MLSPTIGSQEPLSSPNSFLKKIVAISHDVWDLSSLKCKLLSRVSNSLRPHGILQSMEYRPWNSPGQNTGVGSLSLLQGIFLTQGWNPGLPHCGRILYQVSYLSSPTRKSNPHPPTVEAQSLNCWTPREVSHFFPISKTPQPAIAPNTRRAFPLKALSGSLVPRCLRT